VLFLKYFFTVESQTVKKGGLTLFSPLHEKKKRKCHIKVKKGQNRQKRRFWN